MAVSEIDDRGLVMLGCGRMGGAMLSGWLSAGMRPAAVTVLDPDPSDWLRARGVRLNAALPADPAVALVAVKPQRMATALPRLSPLAGGRTLFVSVAAGTPLSAFEAAFGAATRIVRAMPNTPAAIGKGISAIVGNAAATPADLDMADGLLSSVGRVVRLENEDQIDAVTGVSGSGPAYVFHMIEAMAAAGRAQGLPDAMAMALAKAVVAGAGAMADAAEDTPEQLRNDVTSPNGTTQAGLAILMDDDTGLMPLMRRTVAAATGRSRELKG